MTIINFLIFLYYFGNLCSEKIPRRIYKWISEEIVEKFFQKFLTKPQKQIHIESLWKFPQETRKEFLNEILKKWKNFRRNPKDFLYTFLEKSLWEFTKKSQEYFHKNFYGIFWKNVSTNYPWRNFLLKFLKKSSNTEGDSEDIPEGNFRRNLWGNFWKISCKSFWRILYAFLKESLEEQQGEFWGNIWRIIMSNCVLGKLVFFFFEKC